MPRDDFSVSVSVRCVRHYAPVSDAYAASELPLTLDERKKVNDVLLVVKAKCSKDVPPKNLFLLPRFNRPRPAGSPPLTNKPLAADKALATLSVCDGDRIDVTPNPEVAAALTAIGNEFEYAFARFGSEDVGRTCPKCGSPAGEQTKPGLSSWYFCLDPSCDYPTLKLPRQGPHKAYIQARELCKYVTNRRAEETVEPDLDASALRGGVPVQLSDACRIQVDSVVFPHVEANKTMPSLLEQKMRTAADADALWREARKYLTAVLARRTQDIDASILDLLRRYLHEIAQICSDDAEEDPIAAFLNRHNPTTYMTFAASLELTAAAASGRSKEPKNASVDAMVQSDLKQALFDAGLADFVPRQGQLFKIPARAVLAEVTLQDQERARARIDVKLLSPLIVSVHRQGQAGGRAAGHSFFDHVLVDLQREVIEAEIAKGATFVQRVGGSPGFDSGASAC